MSILASNANASASITAAWNGTGTEPANTCITVAQPANGTVTFQITSIPSATITWEATVDGTVYEAVSALKLSTKAFAGTATATGIYFVSCPGAMKIRGRCSTFGSGPVVISGAGTVASLQTSALSAGMGGGGPVTVADGADVAEGTTTDAGIITDASGTVIGFLRGAIKMWINFLARIPAALIGGRFDVNLGAQPATISTANSTTANLGIGAVFTGTAEDVSGYASISVEVFANQSSATGGLSFQFSTDGTNWDFTQGVTVTLNVAQTFVLCPVAQFFRIVYTNGGTGQTAFRLETIYRTQATVKSGAAFQDVNATLPVTYIGQRLAADILVQDPSPGNVSNRVRSAASMAASGGVGGGAHLGMGQGRLAVVHGANPTAITAANFGAAICNRAGIDFVIGGHPNIITFAQNYTGAQTDAAVITIATGSIIVVTHCSVVCHNANTVNVSARVGFGTANVPAYGNAGIILSHPGIGPGSGFAMGTGAGILGIGTDDQDVRLTLSVPTGGSADVIVKYYTIAT